MIRHQANLDIGREKLLEEWEKHDELTQACQYHKDEYTRYVDSELLHKYQDAFGPQTPAGTVLNIGDTLRWCYLGTATGVYEHFYLSSEREAIIDAIENMGVRYGYSKGSFRRDRITWCHLFHLMITRSVMIQMVPKVFSMTVQKRSEIYNFIEKEFKQGINPVIREYKKCIKIFT